MGTKPKSKPFLFLYFNLCSGLDYIKQQAKRQKTQNYFASHHIVFSSDRHWDSRGAWEAIGLFITMESRGAQTDPLALNLLQPQDAVSPWMVPNVAGRATHAAVASPYLLKRQRFQTHSRFTASPQPVTHSNDMRTDT